MKLKMRNVYLLRKDYMEIKPDDSTDTFCNKPRFLEKGLYGWNVNILSMVQNTSLSHTLFIETVTQFQIYSKRHLPEIYLNPEILKHFTELVYAAHCHHSALLIASTAEFPGFEEYIPAFMNMQSAKKCTSKIMLAA